MDRLEWEQRVCLFVFHVSDHHKEDTANEIFKNRVEKVFHGDYSPQLWLLDLWIDSPHGEERKWCLRETRWLPSLHRPSHMLMCWLTTSKANNDDWICLFCRMISNHRMAAHSGWISFIISLFSTVINLLWIWCGFLATNVSSSPLSM